MNKFNVETSGTTTYLVYELKPDEEIDTLSLGMVVNNKIGNVMPIVFTQIDSSKLLKYNISSKIPLSQFFNGVVSRKRLLTVFSSILNAITQATEYMIDSSSFLLDTEHIYVDVSSNEAYLLCMPLMDLVGKPVDLSSFFKNIVFSAQFDQTENTEYVVKLISYLNSTSSISIEYFSKLINELLYGKETPKSNPTEQNPARQELKNPATQTQPNPQVISKPQVQTPQINVPAKQEEQKSATPIQAPKSPVGFAIPGMKPKVQDDKKENQKDNQKEKKSFSLFGKKKEKNEEKEKEKCKSIFSKEKSEKPVKQQTPSRNFAIPGQTSHSASSSGSVQSVQPEKEVKKQDTPIAENTPNLNFGETTVLGGGALGETTVLNADSAPQSQAYLIRKKNNEKIIINKDVFKIGKERNFVDYFIGDNTAISRSHANIILKNGEYFVVDTNSTNHTYINGMILLSGSESKINNGDILRLANEEFTFNC